MKAYLIDSPLKGALKELPEPECRADEVVIKVMASGICGTDIHIFQGEFVGTYPLTPGHEFSGEVVAVGSRCTRIRLGDRVAVEPNIPCNNCIRCLNGQHHYCTNMEVPGVNRPGGMAELVAVKERGVFPISHLSYQAGAMMEPLSCVLHAQKRANTVAGERILILGAGPIGILHGMVANVNGAATIDMVEREESRRERAAKQGWGKTFSSLSQAQREYTLIIDATGVSPLLGEALYKLIPQGRLLLFGVPHKESAVSLDHFFLFKEEIKVIGAYTSLKESYRAIELMKRETFNIEILISHVVPLEQLDAILRGEVSTKESLKIVVEP